MPWSCPACRIHQQERQLPATTQATNSAHELVSADSCLSDCVSFFRSKEIAAHNGEEKPYRSSLMWSLSFKIKASSSCQQRQHKTCRSILPSCYFPVTRRRQERKKKMHFVVASLRLTDALSSPCCFCSHCACLGRSLLRYPFPCLFPSRSKATLRFLLRVRWRWLQVCRAFVLARSAKASCGRP